MQKSDFAILSIEFGLQTFPTLSEVIHFYHVIEMQPESIRQVAKVASLLWRNIPNLQSYSKASSCLGSGG